MATTPDPTSTNRQDLDTADGLPPPVTPPDPACPLAGARAPAADPVAAEWDRLAELLSHPGSLVSAMFEAARRDPSNNSVLAALTDVLINAGCEYRARLVLIQCEEVRIHCGAPEPHEGEEQTLAAAFDAENQPLREQLRAADPPPIRVPGTQTPQPIEVGFHRGMPDLLVRSPELLNQQQLAVSVLLGALRDNRNEVRLTALRALGNLGSTAPLAVPPLLRALDDEDAGMRNQAAVALGRIGPAAAPAITALTEALSDDHLDVRRAAAEALGGIGPAAVPALIEALRDDDNPYARSGAAFGLGVVGGAAAAAVPDLIKALDADNDDDLWNHASGALGSIGAPAVPALVEAFSRPETSRHVRRNAISALGRMNPTPKAASPILWAALNDDDPDVRGEAAHALGIPAGD